MPTYQYRCTDCGRDLEVVQSFSDASLTECPTCTGRLRKVFSSVGVVFKGSGFYKNDSRSSSTGGSTQHRPKDPGDSGTGSTNGTDASASGSGGSDSSSTTSSSTTDSSSTASTAKGTKTATASSTAAA